MALWSGRFEEGVDAFTQRFGASLPVDQVMYRQDIAGSKAHAAMLADQGIISPGDAQAIRDGLDGIQTDIEAGTFTFDINDEDIHMAIERALTERILEDAREIGYRAMVLDTLPFLDGAVRLYEKLGFYRIDGYNDNPMENAVYMQKDL